MSDSLVSRLQERIRKSEFWAERSRETASHFYGLVCPECRKREAWAYVESPFAIICNRKNECGAQVRTLDLFPDVLTHIERDYAPTKEDPDRPAREYLHSRGLTAKSMKGLRFSYWKKVRKTKSGAVMFPIGTNAAGEEVWNGRLFNPPPGEGKTHNKGQTIGLFWRHPGISYDPGKSTYITEGIIDALSLIEMGLQAIAVISAGQDPSKFDLGDLAQRLVIAFDHDKAGAAGLRKWKAAYLNCTAIATKDGDWNDFLRAAPPGAAEQDFQKKLDSGEFRALAQLLVATNAHDYALTFDAHYGYPPGLFEFDGCYHYASTKPAKRGDPEVTVTRTSNFTLKVDHFQLDAGLDDDPVYRYHLRVQPRNGRPICCTVAGSELSAPLGIRATFLNRAKVMWEGEARPSTAFTRMIVDSKAPVVRQVGILGHDRESGCYLFRDFMVDPAGKILLPDRQGFFRASRQEFLRPAAIPCLKPKKGIAPARIYTLAHAAWPDNGPLAIAWLVSSWFVNSVKPELGFFPFLSLHGDTQTGKTRLSRIMNAMQCLDEEGLPMAKFNTGKGEIRKLAQRSGLMKALLEANREEGTRFDFDSLLTLYNYGNALQVRAMKSNDLRVHETDFLGAMMFVQNREPFKTKAQLERVISSAPFSAEDINPETTEAFNELTRVPLRELACFFLKVMQNRIFIEENWLNEHEKAREEIIREINDNRLAENHGLVLAFHRMLCQILHINHDLFPFIAGLASAKHDRCSHRQATLADAFFEAINEVSDGTADRFMENARGRLHVKMTVALKTLEANGYKFLVGQLHKDLAGHPAFLRNNVPYRGYFGSTASSPCKVWEFDARKLGEELETEKC